MAPPRARRRRRAGALALLVAAATPPARATPLTAQLSVEVGAAARASARGNGTGDGGAGSRGLQSPPAMMDLLLLSNNGTCPPGCPLCECAADAGNSTAALECTLSKSIQACRADTFQNCYGGLLSSLGAADVRGLCAVQCGGGAGGERPAAACRICDMLACCGDCPPGRAGECFPPPDGIRDGYTPDGWEPAACGSGGGDRGGSLATVVVLAAAFAGLGAAL